MRVRARAQADLAALALLRGERYTRNELAELGFELEAGELELVGGRQDQYAGALGGWLELAFSPSGVAVRRIESGAERTAALEAMMVLAFTGWNDAAAAKALELIGKRSRTATVPNTAALLTELQALMADKVGPFRADDKLQQALMKLQQMQQELGPLPAGATQYDMVCLDWFDLRNMLLVAQCVVRAAIARKESRGAHQREDFPGMLPEWDLNQCLSWRDGELSLGRVPAARPAAKAA